ncbi:twin-arginine translocation signal domain-containing protein [Streptomyces sp. NBC_01754]|uniref:twin-arginine translocation signal domain-containing protein n=1 Tax=Streptomyces sp. NBC_01754 TaxID=2975930 RepID=UPI002DDC6094|nr:twin-arginine translocation signal domain-containing protein [Streptomyces sp. NBC_01754]WSC97059.1 twin-arginine translocation signal domain-containing protein [Streptomyces sp. NBC_01754]
MTSRRSALSLLAGAGAALAVGAPAERPQLRASEARAHTPAAWLGDWSPYA